MHPGWRLLYRIIPRMIPPGASQPTATREISRTTGFPNCVWKPTRPTGIYPVLPSALEGLHRSQTLRRFTFFLSTRKPKTAFWVHPPGMYHVLPDFQTTFGNLPAPGPSQPTATREVHRPTQRPGGFAQTANPPALYVFSFHPETQNCVLGSPPPRRIPCPLNITIT
jgi:hypothetical protein